ncbi:MAG: enoyl-CoA hydratase/isomerase family protein [Legionellales bacterium]|nr:enoyl-CoA hydratase/isomerase family protein [Legionellales bacterium]
MNTSYQHWQLQRDQHNIVWLTIDRQNSSANSLNNEVLDEFKLILDDIEKNLPAGLIIQSAKTTGFIVGADIEQFTHLNSVEEAVNLIQHGQRIFNQLAQLTCPTLALIDGFCLGGGFELALACRYRVACEEANTKIGLPEVMLGIHPGWGGTVRLPKLIGSAKALPVILSGRFYDARKAYKLGMIDACVPKRHLKNAALHFMLNKPPAHRPSKMAVLSNSWPLRYCVKQLQTHAGLNRFLLKLPKIGHQFRGNLINMIKPEHYPAPFAVVNNWYQYGVNAKNADEIEAQSIGKLLLHPTAKNLVRLFFLTERLKSQAKLKGYQAKRVHVIGAGVMGGDIAAYCALKGMQVTLQDREPKLIGPAVKRAHQLFKKKLKDPRLIQEAMDRFMPDPQGLCIKQADVIIEAIFENLAAKQELFKQLEKMAKPDAILATNTSTILLDDINSVMNNPQRLVGIHFFNPVSKLKLVEVIHGSKTAEDVIKKAMAFVGKIGHYPVAVKSSPGFLVNRILMPYLMEAMTLIQEGVPLAAIDQAAEQFGMPMGPVELIDNVGLDIGLAAAQYLTTAFGGEIPELLKQKVQRGELGKKSGKGFYDYKNGHAIKPALPRDYQAPSDITDRLILRMINEAAACLREHVVADADLLDAAMIYGTGFAPFRGGPMHYSSSIGLESFRAKLQALEQIYGERFREDSAWDGVISIRE